MRTPQGLFEELGFCQQDWRTDLPEKVVFLVDEEANYAHDDATRGLSAKGALSSVEGMTGAAAITPL